MYLNENFIRSYLVKKPGVFNPPETVEPYLRRAGIQRGRPAVVYTGKGPFKGWGDGLEQTMIAYSLARYGHYPIYVLDGGIDRWKWEGRELSQTFPLIRPTEFQASVREDYPMDYQEFLETKDREDVTLLDARASKFYEGQGPWRRAGHIPGAVSLPWASLMDPENTRRLRPEDEVRSMVEQRGTTKDRTGICSCGTGREATNEFILFKWYLGYPDVRIYEGSFTEWTSHPDNPTVTGKEPR
ncbi:MAG: sulfurtransferase [Methanomassiliicoccales archaeon]